jgi:hypothetical protein
VTESNPTEELLACLDVLGTYVDETPDDPIFTESEFFTAVWQTIELVMKLLQDHHQLIELMDGVIREQEEAIKATKLVVANAGDLKDMIRRSQ